VGYGQKENNLNWKLMRLLELRPVDGDYSVMIWIKDAGDWDISLGIEVGGSSDSATISIMRGAELP